MTSQTNLPTATQIESVILAFFKYMTYSNFKIIYLIIFSYRFAKFHSRGNILKEQLNNYVPVNSKTAHSRPRAIPGHLTRTQLRTVENLTQNGARPVGHLTFVSNRLSAVRSKRITKFFDSAREQRSRVIALVDSTWVFLLFFLFCCCRFI